MKASDLFVRCLESEGVREIYGIAGEENADFMLSLDASPIEFVLTRHEQAAAFMAEVQGRLTGRPGVCLATLGPGATNLITGVADGNMDRAPLVVLTGQADSRRQHKESHQYMDVVAMMTPVTKWAHAVRHPDNIPEVVRKAFKLAAMEKPGACHVELAEDIAKRDAGTRPIRPGRARRPVPDDKSVDTAWSVLRRARRPLILAGNGAIRKRASKQLRIFTERTGIGVVSTFMAKGCVDRDAETCLFTIGLQERDLVACAVEAADVVVCLGYDMVEYPPRLWNPKRDKKIVHVDFLPAEVDEHYRVEVEVVGDLAHTLWMLNERAAAEPVAFDTSAQKAVRRDMRADFAAHRDDDTEGRIRPQKVLWDVREALGRHDLLLSDVGAHKLWIARYYHCHEPNTCLIPNGFCSMGFALPGAIAAARVHPDRRILAICGDAGFVMNLQEMETATRLGANVVVMIWEDGAHGMIEWKQETEFGRHVDLSFGNPDFAMLARSFGWHGRRVEKSRELAPALAEAFRAEGPSLLVVPIDYRENRLLTERLGDLACPI